MHYFIIPFNKYVLRVFNDNVKWNNTPSEMLFAFIRSQDGTNL